MKTIGSTTSSAQSPRRGLARTTPGNPWRALANPPATLVPNGRKTMGSPRRPALILEDYVEKPWTAARKGARGRRMVHGVDNGALWGRTGPLSEESPTADDFAFDEVVQDLRTDA